MKKIILILAVFFLLFFWGADFSYALEDTVNVNALVPSAEISPSPGLGGSGGGVIPIFDTQAPQIMDVKIVDIALHSVAVSWKTNENASAYIYYGKTLSYEIGSLQAHSEILISSHEIRLENLETNAVYYFQVRSLDSAGNQSIKDGFKFQTSAKIKIVSNASHFQAKAGDSEIFLSWQNPIDADFQAVKIFRSEKFYSKNPEDGVLIYSDSGNFFADKNLVNGSTYYYTAFAYDFSGNYSSGAVAKAAPYKSGQLTPMPTSIPTLTLILTPTPTSAPSPTISVSPTSGITNLKLQDFNFSQGAGDLKIQDGKIEVESGKSLVVSIDSKKVPEAVGTMMFILAQNGDPQSFLFKNDTEKNKYLVSFAPPAIDGIYSLTIAVLDKNNNPAQAISGNLIVNAAEKSPEKSFWYIDFLWIFLIIFIILVLRVIWKLIKKTREENKGKKKEKDE